MSEIEALLGRVSRRPAWNTGRDSERQLGIDMSCAATAASDDVAWHLHDPVASPVSLCRRKFSGRRGRTTKSRLPSASADVFGRAKLGQRGVGNGGHLRARSRATTPRGRTFNLCSDNSDFVCPITTELVLHAKRSAASRPVVTMKAATAQSRVDFSRRKPSNVSPTAPHCLKRLSTNPLIIPLSTRLVLRTVLAVSISVVLIGFIRSLP
jgi:hypothetical protein